VRRLFEDVAREYSHNDQFSRVSSGALLAALLAKIAREALALGRLKSAPGVGADALRRVEKARELLEGAQLLGVEEVAARVNWSADHLRRVFRQVLGTGPGQTQAQARLKRARALLRDESLPIAEVARRCGFDDPSHFACVFKKDTGLSPRQFLALAKRL
jgi:AraC-like DNA-binding protein